LPPIIVFTRGCAWRRGAHEADDGADRRQEDDALDRPQLRQHVGRVERAGRVGSILRQQIDADNGVVGLPERALVVQDARGGGQNEKCPQSGQQRPAQPACSRGHAGNHYDDDAKDDRDRADGCRLFAQPAHTPAGPSQQGVQQAAPARPAHGCHH
jgi:hypothetical protein